MRKYDGPHVDKPYMYGDRWVGVDTRRIAYTTHGQGPPLIFIRGLGSSADYWDETLPHFEKDFTVYAIDLAGFGKSDKPDVDYSLAFHTRMVTGFMDQLDIKRASFVGNSFGGHVAMNIAIREPERVDKLVLQSTTGSWPPPDPGTRFLLWSVMTDGFFRNWTVQGWCTLWKELALYKTPHAEQKLTEWIRRRNADDYDELCRAYARSIKAVYYGSLRSQLYKIKAPTLILWGTDDRWHPVKDAHYLDKHIANTHLVIFQGGRPLLPWDFKEDFNREVMAFLHTDPDKLDYRSKTIVSSRLAGTYEEY